MFKKTTLLLALALVGCAKPADDMVNAVNKITLPAVTATTDSQANPAELQGMHSANQQTIVRLTAEIKQQESVQQADTDDILNPHSEIHSSFKALTHLEEMHQLNDLYLKDKNKTGLAMIENALKPLKDKSA
ncbi:hypothetical protein [Dryocola clanedunensis]|uniref:hypothetical protein n=1 Tax=Cedecea sulfonylureivorans TaxID=3051154 RepID=UPI001925AD02|nr:hypothetical protein [Cedecea sulfonylureivorans]